MSRFVFLGFIYIVYMGNGVQNQPRGRGFDDIIRVFSTLTVLKDFILLPFLYPLLGLCF